VKRYELGFNWHDRRGGTFPDALARATKARGIRLLRVSRGDDDGVRSQVDRRTVSVGIFHNTQADGLNMESPAMLLCRALKAAGTAVVEDPDDAPVYTDRALLMEYVKRAGIAVPPYMVIANRNDGADGRRRPSRSTLGSTWIARPARGMGVNRVVIRGAKSVVAALSRSKLRSCPRVLVMKQVTGARAAGREQRFVVWHLFGTVVPCWSGRSGGIEVARFGDAEGDLLGRLCETVRTIAHVTGLDWFHSEIVATGRAGKPELVVVEPANALAMLGPVAKTVTMVPAEVARLAADRLAEVAWRRSRGLPLYRGTTLVAPA